MFSQLTYVALDMSLNLVFSCFMTLDAGKDPLITASTFSSNIALTKSLSLSASSISTSSFSCLKISHASTMSLFFPIPTVIFIITINCA